MKCCNIVLCIICTEIDSLFLSLLVTNLQIYFGSSSSALIFAVRFWKKSQFLQKNLLKFFKIFSKIKKINLGDKIKALTFALLIKKRGKNKAKRSLKVWKQQQIIIWLSR